MNMTILLIAFVAIQHIGFLILEMFFWERPLGLKIFKMTQEQAQASTVLAKNQGLYNGFLAAGLIWGLIIQNAPESFAIKVFFLSCVIIAGIYGGITAAKEIVFVQALPAIVALIFLVFNL